MLRVHLGLPRPQTQWSEKFSRLEFGSNPGGGAGAQASVARSRSHGIVSRFGTSTILTVPQSHLEHEVIIEAGDGIGDENSVRGKEN
jgi:hypothetical protein